MRITTTILIATCLLGLTHAAFAGTEAERLDVAGMSAAGEKRPVTTYQVIPPAPGKGFRTKAGKYIIYLNRDGGTYTPGANDSRRNRSTIADQNVTVNPWAVSETGWAQVMSCVQDIFSDFHVEVTDQDPGGLPHIEAVIAGRATLFGLDSSTAGVSPFTSDCSTIDNSIVFAFAEVTGRDYQWICEIVAQEVAHSFGLDHEMLCTDPMSYLGGCGAKTFQDLPARCGEHEERDCFCGQRTQNSVQMLTERIGLASEAPDDTQAPTVSITSPADGATIATALTVMVEASDDIAVSQVDLYIDGELRNWVAGAPWVFNVSQLGAGTHTLEVRAYDTSINVATASVTITVQGGDPDAGPDSPAEGDGGCNGSGHGSAGSLLLMLAAAWRIRRTGRTLRP